MLAKKQFLPALANDRRIHVEVKKAKPRTYEGYLTSALHSEAIYKSEDGLVKSNIVHRDQGSYQIGIPD